MYILICIVILILIVCIGSMFQYRYKYHRTEHFDDKETIPNFEDNIINIYDDQGDPINAAMVVAPMNDKDKKNYDTYKDTIVFLGMTSYLEFPNIVSNKLDIYSNKDHKTWEFDYKHKLKGWFYCFRDPDNYFPPSTPKLLLSESDFADAQLLTPDPDVAKKYDFIYICHKTDKDEKKCVHDDWVAYNKSLDLAFDCINIMCTKFKLKGLVVGRKGCEALTICKNSIEFTEKLKWDDLLTKYNESRFLFVPSIADASPRVITEGLCFNLPVIINKNILGGWKYVNEETGVLFNDLNDFEYNLERLLKNLHIYRPRKYFIENYGIVRSGERMLDFIQTHYGDQVDIKPDCRYLSPRFVKKDYEIQKE
jgi:hypothetical protein